MIALHQIDLSQAEANFAVANTPLFLIRKLCADPAVQKISSSFSGDDILRTLKIDASDKPATLLDMVRPYAYLVALYFNKDASYLKKAAKIPVKHFDWFQDIANVLINTYQSTLIQHGHSTGELMATEISSKTEAPVSRVIIERKD